MAVIVPMVSKKSASMSVKMSSTAATTPTLWKEPRSEKCPRVSRCGVSMTFSGMPGTTRFQPVGLTLSPATIGPILPTASTMIAMTVVATIAMRIAPLTFRTQRMTTRIRPSTKTKVGQPLMKPSVPSWTGTGPCAVRRTKPASTKPMSAMKSPMPTEIATLSWVGTAWKTAVRKPVSTSTRMIRPSMTTKPMASAQVICEAIAKATKALSPRPVASASG